MSLRLKLVVLVLGLVSVLLGGLGLYLGESLDVWSAEILNRELERRSSAMASQLEIDKDGRLELDEDDEHGEGAAGPYRVKDATGDVLAARGSGIPQTEGRLGIETLAGSDGRLWRVLSRTIDPEHAGRLRAEQRPLVLTVAAPAGRFSELSSRFRFGLLLALALGAGLGAAGAALIAQLLSSPLRRLSAEVASIEARSIERRLSMAGLDPDLARLATALNGALDRLERAFRQQKELVARASHALRTPIAAILSTAEVSVRKERDSDAYRAALGDVMTSAREASMLVDQLLALSRADVLRDGLVKEPVELGVVAKELRRLFEPRAEAAGLQLELELPESLAIEADPLRFRELLEALVDNALRYTPRGGRVGVRARPAASHIALEVWDTGLGIEAAEREQVFERFFRGGAAEKSGQPGTGLGLAIVRAIADAHGAPIHLEAGEGGGTSVRTEWPLPGRGPGPHPKGR